MNAYRGYIQKTDTQTSRNQHTLRNRETWINTRTNIITITNKKTQKRKKTTTVRLPGRNGKSTEL